MEKSYFREAQEENMKNAQKLDEFEVQESEKQSQNKIE